jgi:hypothetical protein
MIDSTGLRVHSGNNPDSGPPPKRRAWRKLHLVVEANTGAILASALTTHRARDAAQVPDLLAQMDDPIACAMADGAYDTASVYTTIETHSVSSTPRIVIPPRCDAHANRRNELTEQRDAAIRAIDALGHRQWAHESGYTRRSLVETAMSRYKAIFGKWVRSRTLSAQKAESALACKIMNTLTKLGMPDGHCSA